jgi:hypothetical protein
MRAGGNASALSGRQAADYCRFDRCSHGSGHRNSLERETPMSSITIANAASNALPTVNFRPHGRGHGKKGSDMESQSESSVGSVGQMPVGASQPLLSSMMQSLQQVVGSQATGTMANSSAAGTTAASTTAPAAAAPIAASPTVAQDLSGFMHSLFQALQPGGSAGGAGTTAAAPPTGSASAAGGVGQYQGSLASSLQTLIQQVGSGGATTPAISSLESSLNSLMQKVGGGTASIASTAAAGGATSASSTASLQSVLSNMLQNLQTNGLQMPNLSGSRVNARV